MITVRFPSGFSVQYNEATMAESVGNGFHDIVSTNPRNWFARVSGDCIIEGRMPCRTYFAATPNDALVADKKDLEHKVELLKRQIARLKAVKP